MHILLTDFETGILNEVIHTHTFGEFHNLENLLHDRVAEKKPSAISNGLATEQTFQTFENVTVSNVLQFLLRNEFFAKREGEVFFLTEKGGFLQQQGNLERYIDWEAAREEKILRDLHTIQERGYLDEDQTFKKEHHPVVDAVVPEEQKRKYFGYYLLIIVVLIVLAALGKSHKWW